MSDILIVDDEADIRNLISDILGDEGFATRTAHDADSAMAKINARAPALLILDIWLQGSRMDGIEILRTVKRDNPDMPVVIISGHGNIEIAVAAIKQGAYDFIEKPFNIDQLMVVVRRALEASELRRENANLRAKEIAAANIIGASAAISSLRHALDRVAPTNSRVMLSGPPGSGKEVAARYLHQHSERAEHPFVVVNAASIHPEQMEAVLFGRETQGQPPDPGLFERAHRGVLFIDEVAEMPPLTQSKILRVLVDQTFTRRNGSDIVRVDVRVISATSRDLQREIAEGRFRSDLFHRLSVVPIEVPPLSMRRDDIPILVAHFVETVADAQGLPRKKVSEGAMAALQAYDWPGNVRQLRNIVERLLILSNGDEIDLEDLPSEVSNPGAESGGSSLHAGIVGLPLREAREAFEREYLIAQINRFGGNISRTASFIGMERSALHRKLKGLGVVTSNRGNARVAAFSDDADEE